MQLQELCIERHSLNEWVFDRMWGVCDIIILYESYSQHVGYIILMNYFNVL